MWLCRNLSAYLAVIALAAPAVAQGSDDEAWLIRHTLGTQLARERAWADAVRAFSQAIEVAPERFESYVARGNAQGELGHFAEAKADFTRAAELAPDEAEPRYRIALACIALNDPAGYRAVCADLARRFADATDPKVASPLAYVSTALPNAIDRPEILVRWGERGVALFRGNERVHGATLYRAGRHDEALKQLDRGKDAATRVAWDWLFLAMTHQKLGQADEARGDLARAREWIKRAEEQRGKPNLPGLPRIGWGSWNERAEVMALAGEAAGLIGPGDHQE